MIKVTKSDTVPPSLNSETTKQRRLEIISAGQYPTKSNINGNLNFTTKNVTTYDSRYKTDDITIELNDNVYNCKCAYCEQKVEQFHVEHYRPKSIYFWLAYSWDNLLLCCPYCNEYKSTNFPVNNLASISSMNIEDIHNLRDEYDKIESPRLINPEKEDISKNIVFDKLGKISSTDLRVQETINICRIDRNWLNKRRQELYEDFEKKVISRQYEAKNGDREAYVKLKGLIEDFISDSQNDVKEYIAFRKYIIKNILSTLI